MAIISVPKALREKLGEEGSDALIEIINQSQSNQKTDIIEFVEERFERRLSEEIAGVNHRIDRLRTEMHTLRADLIKWMFIFWVGQVAAIAGILFMFFR